MKAKEVLARLKRIFVKRKYKDVLFRYVFREKKELLQLYNAINHTNYTNPDDLVITTMEDVIYIGMKNDLSFIIANEMDLYEHESSFNENMPLRGLLYFAKLYESYVESNNLNRHNKKRIPLPFPRFVVFYNGEKDIPEVLEMRLSDSFEKREEEPAVECIARFININYGHNQELLNSCKRLHDYSYFVECARGYLRKGYERREAVRRTVNECIDKGILEDVLIKHRAEVEDMFLTTFDKKLYEKAVREEAREDAREEVWEEARKEGLAEGRAEGRAEERENTERERKRAEKAEAELEKLRAEFSKLKEKS